MSKKPTVFISCGQYGAEEKKLGKDIRALVEELTPFSPYFAEDQTSLDGLTSHILRALSESVGFIAVLHPRGTVTYPGGQSHTRASVWVEQEIAIAAYVLQIAKRELHTKAFVHESVKREGMRDFIILNPSTFKVADDVLSELRTSLPSWGGKIRPQADIEVSSNVRRIENGIRYHSLELAAINNSNNTIEEYHVDLRFPTAFEPAAGSAIEVTDQRTASHRLFRSTQRNVGKPLYPGDRLRVMSLDYIEDKEALERHSGQLTYTMTATLYMKGQEPVSVEKDVRTLVNRSTT